MAVVASGPITVLYDHGPARVVTLADGSEWRPKFAGRPPRVGAEATVVRLGRFYELRTEGRSLPVVPAGSTGPPV
jgi:hypothetical protein